MANFTINLEDIKTFEKQFNFVLDFEWLKESFNECNEFEIPEQTGDAKVWVIKDGKDIYVRGEVKVKLKTICVSCLEDISLDIDGKFTVIFTPRSQSTEFKDDIELTEKDLITEYYEGEEIILDNIFRETILLEVPIAPRCSENCEKWKEYLKKEDEKPAEEVDPRWAPLLNIKLK